MTKVRMQKAGHRLLRNKMYGNKEWTGRSLVKLGCKEKEVGPSEEESREHCVNVAFL